MVRLNLDITLIEFVSNGSCTTFFNSFETFLINKFLFLANVK